MNTFSWWMVKGDDRFTRIVVIDNALIEIEKRGIDPWYQTGVWYSSVDDARQQAVNETERLQRLGYEMQGSVRVTEILVAHSTLRRECGQSHSIGALLSLILNDIEEHGRSA